MKKQREREREAVSMDLKFLSLVIPSFSLTWKSRLIFIEQPSKNRLFTETFSNLLRKNSTVVILTVMEIHSSILSIQLSFSTIILHIPSSRCCSSFLVLFYGLSLLHTVSPTQVLLSLPFTLSKPFPLLQLESFLPYETLKATPGHFRLSCHAINSSFIC